jgi:hypothetical protein
MKPTLEDVKEYFKNAKEVSFLEFGYEKQDITECLGNLYEGGYADIYTEFESNGRKVLLYDATLKKYAEIISYKDDLETPKHYDNSKGSIYKFCENQQLNSWEIDCIKRIMRCRKKGNFKEDLEKTKFLIDLYLKEYDTK